MKNVIDTTVARFLELFDRSWNFFKKSYSQEGEDLILSNFLEDKKDGFYVDVGALHPFRFSNTYSFYKRGWRGINIDATPGSMAEFKKFRSRDINLEMPISDNSKSLDYYIFNDPALNGFSSKLSKWRHSATPYKIVNKIKLRPKRLSQVLDKHLLPNTSIDFLSIDVEGYEFEVLRSNNWDKYKPDFILVELLRINIADLKKNYIYRFLKIKNYDVVAITGRTAMFKRLE